MPRQISLFDPNSDRGSWNEQMEPGEYAVHYSSFPASTSSPFCTLLSDLPSAAAYAREQVAHRPALCCTIYDHRGKVGAPVQEIRGHSYKGPSEISARFRRWAGSLLFFSGMILILVDWNADFRLSWPAMIGSRLIIPGLVLLVTEVALLLNARLKQRRLLSQP